MGRGGVGKEDGRQRVIDRVAPDAMAGVVGVTVRRRQVKRAPRPAVLSREADRAAHVHEEHATRPGDLAHGVVGAIDRLESGVLGRAPGGAEHDRVDAAMLDRAEHFVNRQRGLLGLERVVTAVVGPELDQDQVGLKRPERIEPAKPLVRVLPADAREDRFERRARRRREHFAQERALD